MLITDMKLVVEFDGSYWHRGADAIKRDDVKARDIRDSGWNVVRAREAPLKPINVKWDVQIPKGAPPYVAAREVLHHLARLRLVDPAVAATYWQRGLPAAAKEAENALNVLRREAESRTRAGKQRGHDKP